MEFNPFILHIVSAMREFQEKNHIKSQCMTNAQYLYDCITQNNNTIDVKTKAVIVASIDKEKDTFTLIEGHIVLIFNNETIIDPSYEVFSLKNKLYFDNIKNLVDTFEGKTKDKIKERLKNCISNHIHFLDITKRMNNGEVLVSNKEYYNAQADYVEKILRNFY